MSVADRAAWDRQGICTLQLSASLAGTDLLTPASLEKNKTPPKNTPKTRIAGKTQQDFIPGKKTPSVSRSAVPRKHFRSFSSPREAWWNKSITSKGALCQENIGKKDIKEKKNQQATENLAESISETGSRRSDLQDAVRASSLLPNPHDPPSRQSITRTHLLQPPRTRPEANGGESGMMNPSAKRRVAKMPVRATARPQR